MGHAGVLEYYERMGVATVAPAGYWATSTEALDLPDRQLQWTLEKCSFDVTVFDAFLQLSELEEEPPLHHSFGRRLSGC